MTKPNNSEKPNYQGKLDSCPRYEAGQEVWVCFKRDVYKTKIQRVLRTTYYVDLGTNYIQLTPFKDVYSTKQEAEEAVCQK